MPVWRMRRVLSTFPVIPVWPFARPYGKHTIICIPFRVSGGEGMVSSGAGDFLAGLNAEQRAAAEHTNGPLLVVAGAGTGKTKTLASRVAHLIRAGSPANHIVLLTFTRRAAS